MLYSDSYFSIQTIARRTVAIAVMIGFFLPVTAWAQKTYDAHEVQAAFVLNFLKYIEWPIASASPQWTIAIQAEAHTLATYERSLGGKVLLGKVVRIISADSDEQLRSAHAFVSYSKSPEAFRQAVTTIGKLPILTISESIDFDTPGLMIKFYVDGGKMRFEISRSALQNADLRASAQLLRLAKVR
ncbi:MAG: YfiR family protein [Bdellovibrionales bacterium]|nr:YfiR family protein [Bdellovibrionales bacterium]